VDLAREEHAVAVVGKEGVLQLMEGLEIRGPGGADGRAVEAVAPGHVISAVDEGHARVVAVHPLAHLGRRAVGETQELRIELPVDSVLGETGMQAHGALLVVAAENPCECALERHDRRIEYTVGIGQEIPRDDRVP